MRDSTVGGHAVEQVDEKIGLRLAEHLGVFL